MDNRTWKVSWVMYDMTVNRMPRRTAYYKLRALGLTRREAVDEIRCYIREG